MLVDKIDHIVKTYGMKKLLEAMIDYLIISDQKTDYETKLRKDLTTALHNYNNRYKHAKTLP